MTAKLKRNARLALAGLLLAAGVVLAAFHLFPALVRKPASRYYPVQLHLHGSMSEGAGSMRGHISVAREIGTVDALWWTDHDWRIAGHGHLAGLPFESKHTRFPVPYRDTPWNHNIATTAAYWTRTKGPGVARLRTRLSPTVVAAGARALEIRARSRARRDDWSWAGISLTVIGGRLKAPLAADVEVELMVRPNKPPSDDQRAVIRFELSRQPDAVSELAYVLGDPGAPRLEVHKHRRVGMVPVAAPAGTWSRLVLPVTRDAMRFDLGGWDNSLRRISIGMEVRRGARTGLFADELRVRRLRSGAEVLARAEEIAASLEEEYGLVNHVGLEVSYGAHMNVYLPRIELPDFERYPHGMRPEAVVAWAHERRGVASYNHVFGTFQPHLEQYEDRTRYLLDNRAFGADLLEVGYPHRVLPLARHLEVWDELSRDRVFIGGIGASDSHHQREGWLDGNNYVTWVWAEGPGRPQLIAGLRARHAFFGDPVLFKGELDLATRDGIPVGRVIRTSELHREVVLRITRLPEGSTVRWIEQGEVIATFEPPAGDFTRSFSVATGSYRFVRAEVWQGERGLAFSNCLYFLPPEQIRGVTMGSLGR